MPWEDLRYIFGAIMYGGHIVEDWDRRLADAYLSKHFNESLLDNAEFFAGFAGPMPTSSPVQAGIILHASSLSCYWIPLPSLLAWLPYAAMHQSVCLLIMCDIGQQYHSFTKGSKSPLLLQLPNSHVTKF